MADTPQTHSADDRRLVIIREFLAEMCGPVSADLNARVLVAALDRYAGEHHGTSDGMRTVG